MQAVSSAKTVQFLTRFSKAFSKAEQTAPNAIKAYRRALGMNQTQMGLKLGIHNVTLCQIERGSKKASPAVLQRFQRILEESNSLL